jgi:uncharacterized protein (TIGR02300 family)
VGKAELGMKLTCESCGCRFYDLNRTPAKCPKCEAENTRPIVFKTRRASAADDREEKRIAAAAAAAAAKPAAEELETAVEDSDDEDEAVIEDTSDLGEDDDVDVVVEKDAEP